MTEAEFAELAAGAALHALSPDDERRYREALAEHPEWRDIAESDAETARLLADATAPVSPPAEARSALLAQIAGMPQAPRSGASDALMVTGAPAEAAASPASSPARASGSRRLRILFALAACLALLVGIGAGAVALSGYLDRPAAVVALDGVRSADDARQATVELDGGGTATAFWSASQGTAVLVADGIPALAEDQAYELWFLRGDTPVSAGVFESDEGAATAVLDGDMHEGDVIAVTVEQAGGSPTGAPTSRPIIVIPTA